MTKPPQAEKLKNGDDPQLDLIDGVTFLSFESWQAVKDFTDKEERSVKEAERRKMIIDHKKNRVDSADESKSRLSIDSALNAANTKLSSKSAFVSDLLDDYLNQTKEGLKSKKFRNSDFGAPPEDSKIYSTGFLNMDNIKKPFTVLPTVSNVIVGSDSSVGAVKSKCSLKRKKIDHHDSLPPRIKTSKIKMITPKTSGATKISRCRETVFNELMESTVIDIQSRMSKGLTSIEMDEPYVRFAIETIRTPSKEPPKPIDKVEPKELEDVSDVAKMISRHSKRDIRLPARYHNSNIMIGNEWVTPTVDMVSDKKGRKRLVDEQKRLYKKAEQAYQSPKQKSINPPAKNRFIEELQTKVNLESTQKVEPVQEPIVKIDVCSDLSTKKVYVPVFAQNESSLLINQSNITSQELKELYRNLFYENVPNRRGHFQMKGIKPRVNKFETVQEAIDVIGELKKRDGQLAYISKLMAVWNKKLELCRKVIMKEIEPEPTTDGKNVSTVVNDVLKAYQSSICYRIQEALTNKESQRESDQVITKAIDLSSPRTITTTAIRRDIDKNLFAQMAPPILPIQKTNKRKLNSDAIDQPMESPKLPIVTTCNGKGKELGIGIKPESILLRNAPNLQRIITSTPRTQVIRLSGPKINFGALPKGFISVSPASFIATSNGPIVTLDPKESKPNAFAIKLNGSPPVTLTGMENLNIFEK